MSFNCSCSNDLLNPFNYSAADEIQTEQDYFVKIKETIIPEKYTRMCMEFSEFQSLAADAHSNFNSYLTLVPLGLIQMALTDNFCSQSRAM